MDRLETIAPVLAPIGACIRCIQRFAGVEEVSAYKSLSTKVEELIQSIHKDTCIPEDTNVCSVCFGILEPAFCLKTIEQLKTRLEAGSYDADTFALNLKIPSAVLLREYSIREHLKTQLASGSIIQNPFDLKEVLRGMISDDISTALNGAICVSKSEFNVLIEVTHNESADEVKQIPAVKTQLESSKKRRRGPQPVLDGFGTVSRAIAALTTMPETIVCPPGKVLTTPAANIKLERDPVYLQGRYIKYERGLSQTPWVIDGERMGESSVEEKIGDLALPYFNGGSYKFHTAGREDVDVRMLGNGRPFILEIIDAKKTKLTSEDYQGIQHIVNGTNGMSVEIRDVKRATKEDFVNLQSGADTKRKTYCCVVWSEKELTSEALAKLDGIQDLVVQQETPVRVLHRRTLMTRPKVIHDAKCELINKHYMLLRITTSAGAYVKEFVHGDRGRTQPNVASILNCDADILQLDVENLLDTTDETSTKVE